MTTANLRSLVSHLNDTCRQALEGAAGLCLSRTNYNIEVEHWLLKILESPKSDLVLALRHFEIDPARIQAGLTRALDRLKTGNSRPPALAPSVVDLARDAWLVGSLEFNAGAVRSGHVLCALMSADGLAHQMTQACPEFEAVSADRLLREFQKITAGSAEEKQTAATGAPAAGGPVAGGGSGALDQFTVDLTARARDGGIDPVLGRDAEIRQVIDILTRRRQNNPILTGEPGVGKTAVAEGFALKIATGDVPPSLQNVVVRTLDLALLQAGAGMKGEFENRLKNVINEVKASPKPVILFIDEAHTMIGAGGQAGQGDAANLLKPALARGELRTIAATTWAEYKKYFERDAALARRFQVVKIEEPSADVAIQIMRGLAGMMEKHHGVRIMDEAVVESVRLSSRYLSGRQLPDKSVSVLDTACARVNLSQAATPAQIEDCQRRIEQLDTSIGVIRRELASGDAKEEDLRQHEADREQCQQRMATLQELWGKEKECVAEIGALKDQLDTAVQAGEVPAELRDKLQARVKALREIQGESPLVHPFVDAQAIAEVISNWTGIPAGRMVADEIRGVLSLKEQLEERVVGQGSALDAIAQAIRTSRAGLTDPVRPIGVFMLVGTSGVGKTETAIALAELLYGGEQNMTVINMSEFKEEHKVSLLMGSPPGYVGYGEGGILTEAVRRKPYSVVLLDELEKAHPGVQEIFYQVFDKGTLKDGEGRDIDFRNTVILMTTNAGTDTIMSLYADPETMPDSEGMTEALRPELLKTFKPAFLGRTTILPYFPLGDEVMKGIIRLKLRKIVRRVDESYGVPMTFGDDLVSAIAARCTEVETGARNVDHILNKTLLPQMAGEFLSRMADGGAIQSVAVAVAPDGAFSYTLT
ncbi:MAG: type VI secretion system ATPase TssH [Planctomycetes bacterium]|nr:type VI secretion system ATPase TssH [Planctomycetota bacterium]